MRFHRGGVSRDKDGTATAKASWMGVLLYCFTLILQQNELEALCFGVNSNNRASSTRAALVVMTTTQPKRMVQQMGRLRLAINGDNDHDESNNEEQERAPTNVYNLGLGKNPPLARVVDDHEKKPVDSTATTSSSSSSPPIIQEVSKNWIAPEPVKKPHIIPHEGGSTTNRIDASTSTSAALRPRRIRKMVARDNASQLLRGALWHERHFDKESSETSTTVSSDVTTPNSANKVPPPPLVTQGGNPAVESTTLPASSSSSYSSSSSSSSSSSTTWMGQLGCPPEPTARYPNIDLSVPRSVYNDVITSDNPTLIDVVWDNLRYEAYEEAQREPLLVSFLYSTILNHPSLESSLAFCLANRLSTPGSLISTQLQSLILQALQESSDFRRKVRADLLAVRDRDPACMSLPHVFLYFKGFQALQSHRVAHIWWTQQPAAAVALQQQQQEQQSNSQEQPLQQQPLPQQHRRQVLAHYLQAQVSQIFQIDIHPNATMGSGIMLDHGTGIVIGETARVGDNCSILHHVTLGGSGKKGVDRHPKVGNGVLLGAGSTVLGNVHIGNGCQVGAGTLVITDLPPHCVAVGVPAKIIGQFVDVTEQPSIGMNQMLVGSTTANVAFFVTEGI
jgi:serine O-acetyltransferase